MLSPSPGLTQVFSVCNENIKVGKVSNDIRDWSLITGLGGGGGLHNGREGHVKF